MPNSESNMRGCLIFIIVAVVVIFIIGVIFNALDSLTQFLFEIPWYIYFPLLIVFGVLVVKSNQSKNKEDE